MSKISERLPVSVPNTMVAASLLVGGIAAALRANWPVSALLIVLAIVWVPIAQHARRASAGDKTRVGNFEPQDERDRAIARRAFAVVGATALILTGGELMVRAIVGDNDVASFARFMVLASAWSIGVANSVEKD